MFDEEKLGLLKDVGTVKIEVRQVHIAPVVSAVWITGSPPLDKIIALLVEIQSQHHSRDHGSYSHVVLAVQSQHVAHVLVGLTDATQPPLVNKLHGQRQPRPHVVSCAYHAPEVASMRFKSVGRSHEVLCGVADGMIFFSDLGASLLDLGTSRLMLLPVSGLMLAAVVTDREDIRCIEGVLDQQLGSESSDGGGVLLFTRIKEGCTHVDREFN